MVDKAKYILFAIILSIITIAIASQLQPEISFNSGYGWDGVKYGEIAQDIVKGEPIKTKAPFVYRVGVPYLVAKFYPNDIKTGFLQLNWLFSTINAVLLALLLAKYVRKRWLVYLLVFFYITQWHSYFRFGSFYPVQVDPLAISFLLASLLVLLKKGISRLDIVLISLISFVGAFVREIVFLPAILLIMKSVDFSIFDRNSYKNLLRRKATAADTWLVFIPLLLFVVATLLVRLSVEQSNTHRFYNAAADMLYTKSLIRFFHSWLVTYGAMLVFILLYAKTAWSFLKEQKTLSLFLVAIVLFSYAGGADTERIAYWGFPAVFVLVVNLIDRLELNKSSKSVLYGLFLIQLISQRIFNIVPDFPSDCSSTLVLLTPVGSCFPYLNLFPSHSELIPAVIGFAEWCAVVAFFFILKKKSGGVK
jgi:hypothetical protein